MTHYKDPSGNIHYLEDAAYEHLLPPGCVEISDAAADHAYGYASGGGTFASIVIPFPVAMRVAPTVNQSLSGNTNVTGAVINNIGTTHALWPISAASTGAFTITLNTGTSFSAEI